MTLNSINLLKQERTIGGLWQIKLSGWINIWLQCTKNLMVNTAFALKFTTPCKQASKCDIYHLCFWFTPSLHFFASYLHRVNLCKSNFSCSVGLTHHWLGADMDKWNVKELSVCLRGWNRFDRFFFTCRRRGRMSSPQARPKMSGKHGFQTRGAGDEREARVGDDGNERSARAGSDG